MRRREFLKSLSTGLAASALPVNGSAAPRMSNLSPNHRNVLLISVDDMNDWTSGLGGYSGVVHTPNLARLAAKGVEFTNAHCASPVCNPSRTAVFTGLRPSTSGIYNNWQPWAPQLPNAETLFVRFCAEGYRVTGLGKVWHHRKGYSPPSQFHDFLDEGPPPYGTPRPKPEWQGIKHKGHMLGTVSFSWGAWPREGKEEDHPDVRIAKRAAEFLKDPTEEPFLFAVGFHKPHTSWHVPQKYFDLYPLDTIRLPETKADDLDDIPLQGLELAGIRGWDHGDLMKAGMWSAAVRAYLADHFLRR